LKQAGLSDQQVTFPDETIKHVIERYTREAGVRQLERAIGRVIRKLALGIAEGENKPVTVSFEQLADLLGAETFARERLREHLPPGVATGLAWTEAGGDVLYLEAVFLPGGKGLTLTGQLGKVMQESASAAQSFLWSHAEELGIDRRVFRRNG